MDDYSVYTQGSNQILAPHDNSNLLGYGSQIVVGSFPSPDETHPSSVSSLIAWGITIFVSLVPETYTVPIGCLLLHHPINSGKTLNQSTTKALIDQLIQYYMVGCKVYIHCHGGHGRAGTIAAILVANLSGLKAESAIHHVWAWRNARLNQAKNYIPVPETRSQVKLILTMCGNDCPSHLSIDQYMNQTPILDRRDRSWLKKVKADRKINNILK